MWLVINKDNKKIHDGKVFSDKDKENCSIGPDQIWLKVPEGVAPGNAKVQEIPETLEVPAEIDDEGREISLAVPAIPAHLILIDGSADKMGPKWEELRVERNKRLAACDWTVLSDADITTAQKTAWKAYRQALRDVPENTVDPEQVEWPVKP